MREINSVRPGSPPDALYNAEAEQQLLGAFMLNNDTLGRVPDMVPEHFFDPVHQLIFRTIQDRVLSGRLASPVTLRSDLANEEGLKELGGPAYLVRCAGAAANNHAVPEYAVEVRALWAKRELQRALEESLERTGRGDGGTAIEIASNLEGELGRLQQAASNKPMSVSMLSAMMTAITHITESYQNATGLAGIPTGIESIDNLIGGLAPGRLYVLAGRPAMGKAQPLSAMVKTPYGWKSMGDMRVGDSLMSIDGNPSHVVAIHPQGSRQVYKVTFSDGRSTRCCGDHLWHVESSKFSGHRVFPTTKIRSMLQQERYQRRLYVPLVSGEFGGGFELPIDPWLLGALIGNGAMSGNGLSISDPHEATINRVSDALPEGHSPKLYGGIEYGISSARGQRNLVLEALIALGLRGKKSDEKFIPSEYMNASRADRLKLLQGLMDTDGWVEKYHSIMYSTSSPRLARDVQDLVRSLGGICSMRLKTPSYTYKGQRKTGLRHYILSIRHPDPKSLVTLEKKRSRCERRHPPRLTITSVEPIGVDRVQCITVSHPSSLYVTDDYIVTHNSALALNIAVRTALRGSAVWFGSLEMPPRELSMRFFSQIMADRNIRVPYSDIERGKLEEHEFRALIEVAKEYEALPIQIGDPNTRSLSKVRSAARRAQDQYGDKMGVVVIDYLQKLVPPGNLRDLERIGMSADFCKNLATDMNLPVIALAQLSRGVESRDNKRPVMSDLRGSGEIEQEADTILFAYRDAYYLENEIKSETNDDKRMQLRTALDRKMNDMELICAKQRGGRTGTAYLHAELAFNLIGDKPDREEELPF